MEPLARVATYLVVLPLAAAPVALILAQLSRPVRDALVWLILGVTAVLAVPVARAGAMSPVDADVLSLSLSGSVVVPLGLRVDAMSGVLLVLATLVSLVVGVFSSGYVRAGRHSAVYFPLLLVAAGAANGALLSRDLFGFYGFGLLLSTSLALMLSLDFQRPAASAALKLFLMVEGASLVVVAVGWLIVSKGGLLELDHLVERNAPVLGDLASPVALSLAITFVVRAGLAPVHTWLVTGVRNALASAGALIVALSMPLGIYGALRVLGPNGADDVWSVLTWLGALTVLVGALGAQRAREFLPFLAYQSLAQVGLAALALGQGTAAGRSVAGSLIVSLMIATPLLFLGMGTVLQSIHSEALLDFAGQRLVRRVAAVVTVLGMGVALGLPPLPGYGPRLVLYRELLAPGPSHLVLLVVVVVSTSLLALAFLRVLVSGLPEDTPSGRLQAGRPSRAISLTLWALAVACVFFSFAPTGLQDALTWSAFAGSDPPRAGVFSFLLPVLLVFLSIGAAAIWRVGEVGAGPEPVQGVVGFVSRQMVRLKPLRLRLSRAESAGWLDVYAVLGGVIVVLSRASAIALDSTLGRLGRRV